jgi:putative tryptophan/tyrosine transport system substrate-binding protein
MRRLAFFVLAALAILPTGGGAAFAQRGDRVYRLGVLTPAAGAVARMRGPLLPELARLGFAEGRNLVIEVRAGDRDQLPALARDLAAARPDAVIAVSPPAIEAMHQAAPEIPVVGGFIGVDPIAAGYAQSLAHPGGTITGIVMLAPELDAKRLQFLHDAVPGSHRIAALAVNAQRDDLTAVTAAAAQVGVELLPFYATNPGDYHAVFAAMRQAGADAVEIISSPEMFTNAAALAALAIESRLPTMCEWAEMARSGCLLGYGPDFDELERGVAGYVARIFRGAAPGDLPIEGPTHFVFTVNAKTEKALGLALPLPILQRADEVIE